MAAAKTGKTGGRGSQRPREKEKTVAGRTLEAVDVSRAEAISLLGDL